MMWRVAPGSPMVVSVPFHADDCRVTETQMNGEGQSVKGYGFWHSHRLQEARNL